VSATRAAGAGRSGGGYRSRATIWRRRIIGIAVAVAALALGIGLALIISGVSPERALQEITLPLQHEDIIRQQAAEKDLDPALIAAVIYTESRFSDQESSAGAIGLMQITPDAAEYIKQLSGGTTFVLSDLHDPQINISYGTYLLRHLFARYDGNEIAALAAYNAGFGAVDKWGGSSLTLDDIPYPETRAYVEGVTEKRDEYASKYRSELGLR
jgi:soluble lytic murein transglycosylase